MDTLVKKFPNFTLWLVDQSNLQEFSNFVVSVNYKCYNLNIHSNRASTDIEKVANADREHYAYAFYYAIKNKEDRIIATLKVSRWNELLIFPIQNDFGIDISKFINELSFVPNSIWHLGRLAIDNENISSDTVLSKCRIKIFKILFIVAFRHICNDDSNIVFAECDAKLYDKLKLFGIDSVTIGKSKQCLGSETIPIYNTGKELKQFLNKYGHVWDL